MTPLSSERICAVFARLGGQSLGWRRLVESDAVDVRLGRVSAGRNQGGARGLVNPDKVSVIEFEFGEDAGQAAVAVVHFELLGAPRSVDQRNDLPSRRHFGTCPSRFTQASSASRRSSFVLPVAGSTS